MKTVVIYKSRYGYTEKYAKWLSEKLNADLFEAAEIRSLDFSEYDTVNIWRGVVCKRHQRSKEP